MKRKVSSKFDFFLAIYVLAMVGSMYVGSERVIQVPHIER